ncbi:roadblock/LC7 domain-containing protein [Pseudenhygromyxa sp. WMMC2535]|uniref:roadblock/LC7 domain-containing protein n=1 Tax=Pseudenhygromyxa sp. WMMC2535 TaxID=2712867 RepID=UPI00159629DF|nr:roadblock/LC7 domain-containing protein [Pseudenhygromyxa sp. WMMC2535]NVB38272.1 roadblock/LC7 domain-containing protein [Pseudenhygromyxa sp. WMMC2535]
MDEILRTIVDKTPGAKAAILMGFDGIAVEQWVAPQYEQDTDIESMAMEFSFRFLELRDAASSLEMGQISDITLKAEYGTVIVRVLSQEYFVAVVLETAAHMGKGRWILRSQAAALTDDLYGN